MLEIPVNSGSNWSSSSLGIGGGADGLSDAHAVIAAIIVPTTNRRKRKLENNFFEVNAELLGTECIFISAAAIARTTK
ncbi:hypothetical protein GCM10007925_06650 [Sphingomonas astaxanthinifaciens DSM 22298]|uniref:Uncharacterized protein n=1 Tax=Sphingomonas astaxanthinifaciens DSM 22298 TaxID=1123267 RepID=A0ABQ5Z4R7_9SPHN|nr:hypothetical protein GCM10007925_06650 [Sphingomonas astaxanthinifaciens DSM 22298]